MKRALALTGVVIVFGLVVASYVAIFLNEHNKVLKASAEEVEELPVETVTEPEKAVLQTNFDTVETESEYEQTASEESEPSTVADMGEANKTEITEVEPVSIVGAVFEAAPQVISSEQYGVNGQYMDGLLYDYLVTELRRNGIEWILPIAVCQAYQESKFDTGAVSMDGFDKGFFQYRERYWLSRCDRYGIVGDVERSIFNQFTQVYIYAIEMGERLNQGRSIEQALSDHFTGGQGYSAQYVADVLQWKDFLTKK